MKMLNVIKKKFLKKNIIIKTILILIIIIFIFPDERKPIMLEILYKQLTIAIEIGNIEEIAYIENLIKEIEKYEEPGYMRPICYIWDFIIIWIIISIIERIIKKIKNRLLIR